MATAVLDTKVIGYNFLCRQLWCSSPHCSCKLCLQAATGSSGKSRILMAMPSVLGQP